MLEEKIIELEKFVAIQCANGNYNCNAYMWGMANGMIFALSCLKGETPIYIEKPSEWLDDKSEVNGR